MMATDYKVTVDGHEQRFASNHLGHFLFTNLIMGKLLASKAPRIVSVSSVAHRFSPIRWGDYGFGNGESYNRWRAYGKSKTANMLMADSLTDKLGPTHGLTAFSVHPGVITMTNLAKHLDFAAELPGIAAIDNTIGNLGWDMDTVPFISMERGIATHIYGASEPSLKASNGAYLLESRVADAFSDTVKPWATSKVEAERLWKLSEKLVGQEFVY